MRRRVANSNVASVALSDIDSGFADQLKGNKDAIDNTLNKTASFVAQHAKSTSAFIDKTGNLRKSIKKKKSKYPDGGYIVSATGKSGDGQKGYHAHLVEYGHVARDGGRVPPHAFMRPALEVGKELAAAEIKQLKG